MPTISTETNCPNCRRKGATKRKCEGCGQVWCSKCQTGEAGVTCACPRCNSVRSTGEWAEPVEAAPAG